MAIKFELYILFSLPVIEHTRSLVLKQWPYTEFADKYGYAKIYKFSSCSLDCSDFVKTSMAFWYKIVSVLTELPNADKISHHFFMVLAYMYTRDRK